MVTTRSRSNPSSAAAATPAESKKTTSSSAATSKPASSKAATAASKKKDAEPAPADAPEDEGETTKGKKTVLEAGDALPAEMPSLLVHTSGEGEGEGEEKSTSLAELVKASERGVVMFFYPAANTPGCTNQAKLFQENLEKFKGFTVCGCSKDKPPTQAKWHTKLNLAYNLYTDAQADTAELLGLLKTPGRKMQRGVVVVGKDGKVLGGGAYGPAPSLEAALKFVGSA